MGGWARYDVADMGAILTSEKPQPERSDIRLTVEVSVVIPCLNEANSLAFCVDKAVNAFRASGLTGEVIVADNAAPPMVKEHVFVQYTGDASRRALRAHRGRDRLAIVVGFAATARPCVPELPLHAARLSSWAMRTIVTTSPTFRASSRSCGKATTS